MGEASFNTPLSSRDKSGSSFFRRAVRPALFLVGLAFFLSMAFRSRSEILVIFKTLDVALFVLSIFIALIYNVFFSALFNLLQKKYGINISYNKSGYMYFYGQISKYIPGRFWSILYHSSFFKKRGATSAMLFTNLDLTAISILQSIVVAACLILFFESVWLSVLLFIFSIMIFWYLSRSCLISMMVKPVLLRMKISSESIVDCTPCGKNGLILLISTFTWVTYVISGFILLKSAFDFNFEQSALYIAYSAIAWALGVISFVIPAGIGIREFVFVSLAQHLVGDISVPIDTLVTIAIIYRFWHILLEFGGLGVGFILSMITKRQGK